VIESAGEKFQYVQRIN